MAEPPRFPGLEWFRALADQLNAQPEFRSLARWSSARVGFSVHQEPAVVLTIVDGAIVAVEEGEGLRGVDYRLDGPPEAWQALFDERGSLARATHHLFGRLRLQGNIVMAAGDNRVLATICRHFRTVSGGGVAP